jgi:lactam utilization protein B
MNYLRGVGSEVNYCKLVGFGREKMNLPSGTISVIVLQCSLLHRPDNAFIAPEIQLL